MELSENENYIKYMSLFSVCEYELAVEALAKCLKDFRGDNIKESFILKLMADANFYGGKIDKSFECYSMSEEADSESLQPKLFFAEFLAKRVKRYDDAIKKCDEISDLAEKEPIEETEEDFGSDYYASRAEEIKSFCQAQIALRMV